MSTPDESSDFSTRSPLVQPDDFDLLLASHTVLIDIGFAQRVPPDARLCAKGRVAVLISREIDRHVGATGVRRSLCGAAAEVHLFVAIATPELDIPFWRISGKP